MLGFHVVDQNAEPEIAFAEILRQLVASRVEVTQAEIADAIGISASAFSRYLNADDRTQMDLRLRLQTLVRLARFFAVPLDYLVLGDASPSSGAGVVIDDLARDELRREMQENLQMARESERSRRELIARFTDLMVERAEEIVGLVSENNIWPGVLNQRDLARIEGKAKKVDLFVPYLDEDLLGTDAERTLFFRTASNITRGVRYRVLVDVREEKDWSDLIAEYREALRTEGGCPEPEIRRNFQVRQLHETVFAGFANYWLDRNDYPLSEINKAVEAAPTDDEGNLLFSILQPGLSASDAHTVLRSEHARAATVFFDRWWDDERAIKL